MGFCFSSGSEQISEIEFSWYDKRELWNEPFEIFKIWQDAPCWRKQKKGGCGKYQYKLNCNKCYPYNTKNSFHFFHIQMWKLRACKFQSMVNRQPKKQSTATQLLWGQFFFAYIAYIHGAIFDILTWICSERKVKLSSLARRRNFCHPNLKFQEILSKGFWGSLCCFEMYFLRISCVYLCSGILLLFSHLDFVAFFGCLSFQHGHFYWITIIYLIASSGYFIYLLQL